MHGFLEQLQTAYSQIAENQLGRLTPGLTSGEFIAAYRNTVNIQYTLRAKTNDLINNKLYPMLKNVSSISDEEENDLYDTAQKLSSYAERQDPGFALNIYQSLLERARYKKDTDKIIKYLYWCGITMFFFLYNRKNPEHDLKMAAYFEEGSEYYDRYDTFADPETRQYIHRCLGNRSMMYYRLYGPERAIQAEEENFAFWNGIMFRGKDPDFPWLSYFLSCFNHRHNEVIRQITPHINALTKEECSRLLEISMTINKLYHKNHDLYDAFGGTRYDFLLWRAQFLSGLISFEHLRANISNCAAQFEKDDCSFGAIFIRVQAPMFLIAFVANMQQFKDVREKLLSELLEDTLNHLSSLPQTVSPTIVSDLLNTFASEIAPMLGTDEQINTILRLTAHRHIRTYAHSEMVSKLSMLLTRELIKRNPGHFAGCLGISSADDAASKTELLLHFSKTAGLCHDIGVISYASNPFMNTRILTDDEFGIIMQHPKNGAALLSRGNRTALEKGYADVVLGHHKYYDNTGGFPEDFDRNASDVKAVIDIVSIANTLDSLTDDIAQPASDAKSLRDVCDYVLSLSGSRFCPVVSSLLKEDAVISEIDSLLAKERTKAYYAGYLLAWEGN